MEVITLLKALSPWSVEGPADDIFVRYQSRERYKNFRENEILSCSITLQLRASSEREIGQGCEV